MRLAYVELVRKFYVNMCGVRDKSVMVDLRGKEIYMDAEIIRQLCHVPHVMYSSYPYMSETD